MPFQKGHKLAKGRPVGSKNTATLLKEERRAIFEHEVTQVFIETIHKARPEYLLDQYLGKAAEEVNLKADIKSELSYSPQVIAEAKRLLKDKLTDE